MSAPRALPDLAIGPACVPGEAVEVDEHVVRLTASNPSMMTGPGTNSYLVGSDELVVIDPGPLSDEHLGRLVAAIGGRHVTAVAVTHHHRDHSPGARALADAVDAPVVGHGHAECAVDVVAREGTVVQDGTTTLVAWHTPGHASDHLCYFVPATGWLFTGDHVMQGSTVVIRPPDGDLTDYLVSLARVRDDPRLQRIAPGHGRVLRDPSAIASAILEHRAARGAVVLEALRDHGPSTAAALRPFAYPDVAADRDVVATATCWAHLLAMVVDRTATTTSTRDDPDAVFALASSA